VVADDLAATVGSSVWYVKAKPLQMATCWAWLIRMNAAVWRLVCSEVIGVTALASATR